MAERPILALPRPTKQTAPSALPPREPVLGLSPTRQSTRLGPKFDRLAHALSTPAGLAELRSDPQSIAPERALVFEVAGSLTDFYRAARSIDLEFLGEEEGEFPSNEDFIVTEKGIPKPNKNVPVRFYFTFPDQVALAELVSLWRHFLRGEELGYGRSEWRKVFEHLTDIRPWGPQDRLTPDAMADWEERLESAPDKSVRFEVEFWYRTNPDARQHTEHTFATLLERVGGQLVNRANIEFIRYHAALVDLSPEVIKQIMEHPDVGMATFDEIMLLRPQSIVSEPVNIEFEDTATDIVTPQENFEEPVVALFDGLPMAAHDKLKGRLTIDDPDDFEASYGLATEQRHGTAMASLILHGDLNNSSRPSRRRLYVRPVLAPQPNDFEDRNEYMPVGQLGVDLMWRAFRRLFEEENGDPPVAPSVRIVNLSLGDSKRRFAGVMSPWAHLLDALAWQYGLLILVSAGNIRDELITTAPTWGAIESAAPEIRQAEVLRSILNQRAIRKLLSPAEAINVLTIGACHFDSIVPNGSGIMAADPYASLFLPNPSSALGLGFRRGVKPELLMPGGREHVQSRSSSGPIMLRPVANPGRNFGIGVACPGLAGETDRKTNLSGTSVATALATNAVTQILEAIEDIPDDPAYPKVDPKFHAIILKSLLVHTARWDEPTANTLKGLVNDPHQLHWTHERDEISRFLGFGCPDISRVLDCTAECATLIGWGHLRARESDVYRLPLPPALQGIVGFRSVSITVAWLTPLTFSHRNYRMAKLEAGPGGDPHFSLAVKAVSGQPSDNAAVRGTVFHRRWEGDRAATFVDGGDLVLNVSCKPSAGELDQAIPYSVTVSLEVGQDVAITVYDDIRARLRVLHRVRA